MSKETANDINHPIGLKLDEAHKAQVRHTLEVLLHSSAFSTAQRSRRFISYVVEQALSGNGQNLKERTIGIEVFDRPPSYSTGDDPIVRVQAGDVRKRLERFNQQTESKALPAEITLYAGSYCPEFHFRDFDHPVTAPTIELLPPQLAPHITIEPPTNTRSTRGRMFFIVSALLIAAAAGYLAFKHASPESPSSRFWHPLFTTAQPALICVEKIVTYQPSKQLYDAYAAHHDSDEFKYEWQRLTQPLPLDPQVPLRWGDLRRLDEFGVASGDVYASAELSAFFGRIQKVRQLRIGSDYSFEDLRRSPAVLVGAFNNRWTMQIVSDLPYHLTEDGSNLRIQEMGGEHRTWEMGTDQQGHTVDYAIVARLLNSGTGQFVVIIGGIGTYGTEAASDFITNPAELDSSLRDIDSRWASHNLIFIVKTTVTDRVAGPPSIVASTIW